MKQFEKGIASILLIGAALAILIAGGFIYFTFRVNKVSPPVNSISSTISGTIDFNGVAPSGATIAIGEKGMNDKNFNIVVENIPAVDHSRWSWNQAKSGQEYQMQAFVRVSGKDIISSEIKFIAAPAVNQTFLINMPSQEIAQENKTAAISGSLDINGYIPPQSTISVLARNAGSQTNFKAVLSNLATTDGSGWVWNQATEGQSYEVKLAIIQNGVTLVQSEPRVITAPATDEVLRIVSNINPPKPAQVKGVISGAINLNGLTPQGSSIVIVARPSGTVPFAVVQSGIPAQNGASWNWNGGIVGTSYDLQAVLKVNGNDFAISNTLTVPPIAQNEVLTINSNLQQPQPGQQPSFSCNGQSNGLWAINITYNYVTVSGTQAAQYWVRLGDPNSDNRYMDTRISAQNQSGQTQQSITSPYVLGSGGTYYVKYAYSLNPTSGNLSDFSAWSNVTGVVCPVPTTPPTPTPSPTPIPTPTPTPTPSPSPSMLPQ